MKLTSKNLIEGDYLITPDGLSLNLNDGHGMFLISASGYGMPPLEYQTQQGPYQHGETALDYRLRPRIIQLAITKEACNRQEWWDLRKNLLDYVRPNRQTTTAFQPSVIRKVLPDGDIRDLDVFIRNGPSFQPRPGMWDEFGIFETLQFVAYDPTFYDPTINTVEFDLDVLKELVFPFTFQPSDPSRPLLVFGASIIDDNTNINYLGNWLSYPTIILTGPFNNPTVQNVTTGESIELEYNIPAAEVVTINLDYGQKTVTNDSGDNLIGTVVAADDLATFHLAPDPEATDGINVIKIMGAGASPGETSIEIQYYNRYIGI